MFPHRLSLRDVAARARVSTATVSLALRDSPRISLPVRLKVQALAQEMGYQPDPLVARLAANGWNARRGQGHRTIAFLSGVGEANERRGLSYLAPLEAAAPRMGYRIEYFNVAAYRSPARLANILRARGIEGVLLHQVASHEFVKRFPWERFATVACSISIAMPPVHIVAADYTTPVRKSWEACVHAGYRRVGFALLKEMSAHDDLPRTSIADYLERKSAARVPVEHFSLRDGPAFQDWVKRRKLDAVIGLNDLFHWWLAEAGHRFPEPMGFVSLMLGGRDRSITGWNTRDDLVAVRSLEQVDLMLRASVRGLPESPYSLHITPTWVSGNTLRAAAPA